MPNETGIASSTRKLAAPLLAFLLAATSTQADNFPSGQGDGFNERDDVTGYLCVTPGCDVLRPPGMACICTKDNPWASRLSELKLTCRKKEKGQWVACPIQLRYGK